MDREGRVYISVGKKRNVIGDGVVNLNGNNFTTAQVDAILQDTFHDREKDNITRLCLKANKLDAVPEAIKSLTNLKELYLCGNQIQRIPGWIWKLSNLERLFVSHNNLHEIPSSIEKLSNLQELWLTYNNLSVLPLSMKNLTQLKVLDLIGNSLLPDSCEILLLNGTNCPRWQKFQHENALVEFRLRARRAAVTWILVGKQLGGLCKDVVVLIAKLVYATRVEHIWE